MANHKSALVERNAKSALKRLKEGNLRFTKGLRSIQSFVTPQELRELASRDQTPFCIVLSCSDSRIPIEILFDCGPGDIFVCRVAGNVLTPALLGSIEFAATQFGVPLCVIMGHSGCGAVKAAMATQPSDKLDSENIKRIMDEIWPTTTKIHEMNADARQFPERYLDVAVKRNTVHSAEVLLERSPIIREMNQSGKIQVVSAFCDLRTGGVEFDEEDISKGLNKAKRAAAAVPRGVRSNRT